MISLFDTVRLKKDDSVHGVSSTFDGVVVYVHENGEAFTVEFFDENGDTIEDALLTEYGKDELIVINKHKG